MSGAMMDPKLGRLVRRLSEEDRNLHAAAAIATDSYQLTS
jgi:hypothetical protein